MSFRGRVTALRVYLCPAPKKPVRHRLCANVFKWTHQQGLKRLLIPEFAPVDPPPLLIM